MSLISELTSLLKDRGAQLVGVGDLSSIQLNPGSEAAVPAGGDGRNTALLTEAFKTMKTGVSVALPVPASIVEDLKTALTLEYYHAYNAMNKQLNEIVLAGERFLQEQGYHAHAQTTDRVTGTADNITPLPHKTVAARAGLGWIGKSCLLVTPQYGSAVRLSSIITDAPRPCSRPVLESRCGTCRRCVDFCPAGALKGTLWKAGMPRPELFDWKLCYPVQVERMRKYAGISVDLCGRCFAVCPFTQKYLARNQRTGRE